MRPPVHTIMFKIVSEKGEARYLALSERYPIKRSVVDRLRRSGYDVDRILPKYVEEDAE